MDWRALGEVCTFIDYRGKTPTKTTSGIPLITAKIIKSGFIEKPQEYIAESDYEAWMRRGIPTYGAVVFTTEAPLGEVAQIKTNEKIALAQRVITITGISNVLDNNYLKYVLQYSHVVSDIQGRASGTTVQGIKSTELRKVKIPVPDIKVQMRIGNILGTIDDKIELNRRMNETLEQMAMALYKHWFGEGEIEQQLSDLIDINPTINIKKGTPTSFVDMKALPVDSMSVSDDHIIIKPFTSGSKFIKNDVLFARITPCLENGKTAYVDFLEEGQAGFGSTEFLVFRAKGSCCSQYVYCLSRDPEFRAYAIKSMVGTSGRQRVQTSSISEYLVAKPDPDLMRRFDETTKDWFSQIRSNTKEISKLKKLRDFLLPRLLSGEIEVKVAEEQAEEVLAGV